MSNINDTYFDGHYKEIWRTIIPDELTVKETDFILNYFTLEPVLPCLTLCADMAGMLLHWQKKE